MANEQNFSSNGGQIPNWNQPTAQTWWPSPWYGPGSNGMNSNWNMPQMPPAMMNNQSNQNTQAPNTTANTAILGKLINSPSEIQPQDIPNDHSIAYFPMRDQTGVYARYWDNDWGVHTIKYVREDENITPLQSENDPMVQMSKRLDQIEDMLRQMVSHRQPNGQNQRRQNNQDNRDRGGDNS